MIDLRKLGDVPFVFVMAVIKDGVQIGPQVCFYCPPPYLELFAIGFVPGCSNKYVLPQYL